MEYKKDSMIDKNDKDKNGLLTPVRAEDTNMKDTIKDEAYESLKNNSVSLPPEVYRNILKGFGIFSILKESDVEELRTISKDKNKVTSYLNRRLELSIENIKHLTKLEIFVLLTIFCFQVNLEIYEICSLFSIMWDILNLNFRKNSKKRVFEIFKESLIKHSVDRPPFQIGIYRKSSLEAISVFFIENIYTKFELIQYLTTDKKLIELSNSELFNYGLPPTMDIELGEEILPRHSKILKPYYETRKPKSELEQKIDKVLEFEREKLDKELEEKFAEQDVLFNKKLDDLISKKKK